jgi:putative ABC transport system permease protein
MLVVVGERTDEIGLRKAVGARDLDIFSQFMAEAAAVCGLSGIVGATLGVGLSQLIAVVMPEGGPLGSVPAPSAALVVGLTLSLIGVGMIAGIVPAIRAARVPPAEALRA